MESSLSSEISLRGVRVNNLRGIDVDLPLGELTVVTGVTGSGRRSLVFGTLYAEAQRRYLESFPAAARRYLERWEQPEADYISGLPPAVAIRQLSAPPGPRTTLATLSEVINPLRLLFSRYATAWCLDCEMTAPATSAAELLDEIRKWPLGTRFWVGFEIARETSQTVETQAAKLVAEGWTRVWHAGEFHDLKSLLHDAFARLSRWTVVVDRLTASVESMDRCRESLEQAFSHGAGAAVIARREHSSNTETLRTVFVRPTCPVCRQTFPEFHPFHFSWNSSHGACSTCRGTGKEGTCQSCAGTRLGKPSRGARLGGLTFSQCLSQTVQEALDDLSNWRSEILTSLQSSVRNAIPNLSASETEPHWIPSPRLRGEGQGEERSDRANHPPGFEAQAPDPGALIPVFNPLIRPLATFSPSSGEKAMDLSPSLEAWQAGLQRLSRLGLGSLRLDLPARHLLGGECYRARLAAVAATGLVETLFLLEEPTSGIPSAEIPAVVEFIREWLHDGNTLVVLDGHPAWLQSAVHRIVLGPGSGRSGGQVLKQGMTDAVHKSPDSGSPPTRSIQAITRHDSRAHPGGHLQADGLEPRWGLPHPLEIPLGKLTYFTGTTASGLGRFWNQRFVPSLQAFFSHPAREVAGIRWACVEGTIPHSLVVLTALRTQQGSRHNPAIAVGAWTEFRRLLAASPEAKLRNLGPGMFSLQANQGGRCTVCSGTGSLAIDLQFLPDLHTVCPECRGRRFQRDVLEVKIRGLDASEILNLSAAEALPLFRGEHRLTRRLKALKTVGLGEVPLGQPTPTLSPRERQSLELACQLAEKPSGARLYLLEEPARGLPSKELEGLFTVLELLLEQGHTLVVLDHSREWNGP